MLDYTKLKAWEGVDPWPPFDDLPFVTTTEGNPQHSGRFDQGGFGARTMVGVWECTEGKFEYTYPGDEICTLLEGHIRVTEKDGSVHEHKAGDTFFTVKNETVNWEVVEKIRKIFFIHDIDGEVAAA